MIEVIVTACSILFSGPIDSVNSPELKNGTCREFHLPFEPSAIAYGIATDPIFINTDPEVTAAQCMKDGQIAIEKWKQTNPYYINKWRCDAHPKREDI